MRIKTSKSRSLRRGAIGLVAGGAALGLLGAALPVDATLTLLQPDAEVPATFVGRGGVSTDGLGQFQAGGTIQAEVPAGSAVEQAYLYGAYTYSFTPDEAGRTIDFGGEMVITQDLGPDPSTSFTTSRADVTDIVAAEVGSGGGVFDFVVNNDPSGLEGVALVVIYSNPDLPTTTVAIADGESTNSGDSFSFGFATPLEPDRPGFTATLAVGSGFSYQSGVAGHACGGDQFSIITVNAEPLSSCAGNFDDGEAGNGALITVGGVGDSTDNPADPLATDSGEDDELYDLVPFLEEGDTEIEFTTSNPSSDDNLFLAVLSIGQAAGDEVTIPVAVDDTATTDQDTPVTINVQANDDDPDGVFQGDSISIFSDPSDGSAEVVDGQVEYTPNSGFSGEDTFEYQICGVDDTVCDEATVTVTVIAAAVPAPPVPAAPTFTG
jgi:hypothetical protein